MTLEEYYETLRRMDKLRQLQFEAWLNSLVNPIPEAMDEQCGYQEPIR